MPRAHQTGAVCKRDDSDDIQPRTPTKNEYTVGTSQETGDRLCVPSHETELSHHEIDAPGRDLELSRGYHLEERGFPCAVGADQAVLPSVHNLKSKSNTYYSRLQIKYVLFEITNQICIIRDNKSNTEYVLFEIKMRRET